MLAAHPKAQKIVMDSRRDRPIMLKKSPGFWPDWCFFPMAGAKRILDGECFNHFRSPSETALLTASLSWMQSKGIYRFDQTLFELLAAQPMDGDIPGEALERLPEFCVYIEVPMRIYGQDAIGFWAWMEIVLRDDAPSWAELRLLYLMSDGDAISVPVPVVGTLPFSLKALEKSNQKILDEKYPGIGMPPAVPTMAEITAAMNLVLYLCSDEPDVTGRIPRQRPRRPSGPWVEPQTVAEWNVGIRIGSAIRHAEKVQQENSKSYDSRIVPHVAPRPHIRRAHWHAFWTGPKAADKEEQRCLIIRWLPPIPVKMDWQSELPVVVHPVKE